MNGYTLINGRLQAELEAAFRDVLVGETGVPPHVGEFRLRHQGERAALRQAAAERYTAHFSSTPARPPTVRSELRSCVA
jgi:hypothetical protein